MPQAADDVTLEDLYPDLVTWRVSLDDRRAAPEKLVRLFQLTQLAMEVQDLSAAHSDENQALRADLDEATKEVTPLRTDLTTAEEQVLVERAAAAKLRDEVRFERMRNKDLELVVDSLNLKVKELKAAQARTLGRRNEDENRTEIREEAQLVAKYLTEVQMLSAQNSELGDEVAAMTGELEAVPRLKTRSRSNRPG
ncbi:hypothetical protein AMAG_06094 [Allomyces macrogynus ATCC 38327]|uniref:Autophagy-related protein 16 domain-containing protein n=1 Tax=Allomyces macrogynus (strain ATCC 38327) TaxID=578462 RepID=A0A0L0SE69_ALLM3|nr:hypothetical protein AMAG_06094 [Allomyces macrogynus ATCC 38327]|eukprot:KNE60732.1 hypothetical protein AMAG_06094 [Allomyces macrogynus ATCC 38327]